MPRRVYTTDEERVKALRAYQQKYYKETRERQLARAMDYYDVHRDTILQKRREKRKLEKTNTQGVR